MSVCKLCKKEFNQYQGKNRTRCGACNTKIRRHRTKQKAIDYLGGKCNRCGYNENIVALEFHHIDPNEKEFQIGSVSNKSWESIINEIKKCELLCSNCHRIEHSSLRDEEFLNEVLNYKGKLLGN